ncbi:MAG: hypothetical protein KDG55_10260 [Rhodocyclaceae bacterium]|nr:hypothetical protein [Rhodocyclaceae bacterium]
MARPAARTRKEHRPPARWWDRLLALLLIVALAWTQVQVFAHGAGPELLPGLDICTSAGDDAAPMDSDESHDCVHCCCCTGRDTAWLPSKTPCLPTAPQAVHERAGIAPPVVFLERRHERPAPRAPPAGA